MNELPRTVPAWATLGRIAALFTLVTAGCSPPGIVVPTDETGSTEEADTDSDGSTEGGGPLLLPASKDVDVLFVIDNSGSMGEEQARLAWHFESFINVLEHEDVDANYRIGFTTSDNGNPWCPSGQTTPESGKLVASSCKTRLADFEFNNGETQAMDIACNDICILDDAELQILPTRTDLDPVAAPRPWLERIEGVQNLPEGTDMVDASRCFMPQGINGCGFESPLESMYLALLRAQSSEEESYGFLRASALLAVMFVTDEADCSYDEDWSEIFEADGNRVFWSDPDAAFPTSAVCWNAGVECLGDPNEYDSCEPLNYDVDGNADVADAQAVLHPMSRYAGLIAGLQAEKQLLNPGREVVLGLLGGVSFDGQPFYSDDSVGFPQFYENFGIGPGCAAVNPANPDEPLTAVPPVRLRALVEAFTPDNMFAICEWSYHEALESMALRIRDQLGPICYSECVADSDPQTELVEPSCIIQQDPPGNDNTVEVPECLRDADGYVLVDDDYLMPSEADDVCYAMRVDDQTLTPSPADDMSFECADGSYNLEFEIVRRRGTPAPDGTVLSASCALAEAPELDCPGLGG